MRFSVFVALAFLAACGQASADVVSSGPEGVSVTLYHDDELETSQLLHPDANPWIRNEGLAFVVERRTIDLPAGPAVVKFRGVAATMVPQTADVAGLPAGVVERNFDYDLLSPGSLLAKSVGQSLRLVRLNPKTGKPVEETAIVRSGPDGAMLEIGGRLEALRCSGLPEKLIFDHLPDNLADTPTLSVRTLSSAPGRYTITLSYIATGLNWSADYVARSDPATGKMAMTGWLTLANFSATSFPRAPIDVVAGKLATTGDDNPVHAAPLVLATHCWPMNIDWATHHYPAPPPPPPPPMQAESATMAGMGGGRGDREDVVVTASRIDPRQLGDYKLYPLPEPTDLHAQQTKQIQFLDQDDVRFERIYRYAVEEPLADGTEPAEVIFRMLNKAESGLGKPLPAGSVSVFEPGPDGSPVFAGQNTIEDMAVGLPVEVETGHAMDVRVTPRRVQSETSGEGNDKSVTEAWEITIANDKSTPVAFELTQHLYGGQAAILSESLSHGTKAGQAVWSPTLAAGQQLVVRYVIRHPE
jgi:hypothetical protein